jgi:hypothetical protein
MNVSNVVVDRVELIATELVTNSVLHANAGPTVTVRVSRDVVRIEVQDDATAFPVLKQYGDEAITGRGLGVVTSAASDWGVVPDPMGKTVWAEVATDAGVVARTVRPNPDLLQRANDTRSGEEVIVVGARNVHYVRVPVDVYLALEQHNEALLREFELLAIQLSAQHTGQPSVPMSLAELVVKSRRYFTRRIDAFRLDVQKAAARGHQTVDLSSWQTSEEVARAKEFLQFANEADVMSEDGLLLTAPATDAVAWLRQWFVDQLTSQVLDGEQPTAATASPSAPAEVRLLNS